jgi:PAS domain S-box-containing protein
MSPLPPASGVPSSTSLPPTLGAVTLAEAIEKAPFGVLLVDSQLAVRAVNATARPMLGSFSEPIGVPLATIAAAHWPSEIAADILQRFRHTLATGERYERTHFSEKRKDTGQVLHVSWEVQRLALSEKEWGVVCYFFDTSAFAHAQGALRRTEARFRAMFNQAAVGIAISQLDFRFDEVNERFCEITGYTASELKGRTFRDLTHPDDIPATLELVKALVAGKIPGFAQEKRYVRKSGEIVWSLTNVTMMRDEAGSAIGFIGTIDDITRRKEAEAKAAEAQRQSDEELRALADTIPQLVWIADPTGHITWYNRRWYDYTGTTFEQMQGWGWQSVHDPKYLEAVVARWRHSLATGEVFEMEFPLRGADGKFRWFLTRVNPVRDADGKIVRWFGTNTDVDHVKRVEEALREESRILELLNETGTKIGAAKLDVQSLLQTVTDASTQLTGAKFGAFFYNHTDQHGAKYMLYTLSGAPREAFDKFGHPRATPMFAPTFRGEGIVRVDDVMQDPRYGKEPPHHGMPQGHLPVRSYLAVPVKSRSGEVFGGLFFGHPEPGVFTERAERLAAGVAAQAAIAIDNARLYEAAQRELAERTAAEAKLRESEARLRLSIEATALGTWMYLPDSGMVMIDERAQELYALSAPEVPFATFVQSLHPADRPRYEDALQTAVRQDCTQQFDLECRVAPDGAPVPIRWIRVSGKCYLDDGKHKRLIGTVFDVTDVVRARETLSERRAELEKLVNERTASLQEAIAAMEEFSYSVSHDVRAPLRAIQGYAQAALEDYAAKLDETGKTYLQRIVTASARMDRLTQDVLTYSRLGRTPMQKEAVSLEKLVPETIQQYIYEKAAAADISIERPLATVMGHEPLIAQVVANLVGNGLKFVPKERRPQLRIWTERRDDYVRVFVADNGIGVPQEHQTRIWGMFERLHPASAFEGTGIGLAIVRKAVERMGGKVGVESDGSSGSTFWFELPAA